MKREGQQKLSSLKSPTIQPPTETGQYYSLNHQILGGNIVKNVQIHNNGDMAERAKRPVSEWGNELIKIT